ncbi:TPA: hypothetical protein DD449_03150 [Candidatus Berkelbacteria bacterium]|uniref:Uncharacterized protein n=1 Tax=Berkelbacteria bacterium GW2011_GWE1_39_12 TaxID=1618337 RepID=A0A0G4B3B4_9BACT|nr:MAG: hypothetical protein UT28_C0001G0259 [Berkelbacteria bacterium GW2011_GWE1_39_12]HBO60655.1 hypothetical protein [Candidatus Berkelbacteria bacterium]
MNRLSWIFIGSTSLIVVLFSYFILKPMVNNSWQIHNEIKKTKTDLQDASKKKEVLTALSKNNQLDTLYGIASKYIPLSQNSSELVIEMSAVANQANLKVEQFSLDNSAPKAATTTTPTTSTSAVSGVTELKFSIKVSGNFSDFLTFLKNTETSSRLITFNSMQLATTDNVLSVQLIGSAYWQKDSNLDQTLTNVTVTQSTIDKFQNLKSYGTPINLPAESGFGRTNPFDVIK